MFIDVLEQYSNIILDYEILQFRIVGESYQLIAKAYLINDTELHVKDYLFLDGLRKYSYHWQDKQGNCIIRWDNAPHHQTVESFPFHKHIGKDETIAESPPVKLHHVLGIIEKQIKYS